MDRITLAEKTQQAISDLCDLNNSIHTISKATTLEELQIGLKLIPEKVFWRITDKITDFRMRDITRAEFVEVLKVQMKLRKRSLQRYLKMKEQYKE